MTVTETVSSDAHAGWSTANVLAPQRPALARGSRLNARPLLLLGALAQLLSSRVALKAGRLQFLDGAVVDDVDIFR